MKYNYQGTPHMPGIHPDPTTTFHKIQVQPEKSSTGKILLLIGVAVFVLGIVLGISGFTSVEEDPEVWVSEIQSDIDDAIIWQGTGEINESISLDPEKSYGIAISQDSEIFNLSISEENMSVFRAEQCADSNPDDSVEDCKDYTHYRIGQIENVSDVKLFFNSTGEVVIIDNLVFFKGLESTVWEHAGSGLLLGFVGGGCSLCLGVTLLAVGAFINFKK
jgi:hypothetical protein